MANCTNLSTTKIFILDFWFGWRVFLIKLYCFIISKYYFDFWLVFSWGFQFCCTACVEFFYDIMIMLVLIFFMISLCGWVSWSCCTLLKCLSVEDLILENLNESKYWWWG